MAGEFEQVEKLREKTHVTYEQARDVLAEANGDLLEALILLERRGQTDAVTEGGFYSTKNERKGEAPLPMTVPQGKKRTQEGRQRRRAAAQGFFQRLTENHLEVWQGEQKQASIPLIVLAILTIFFPWITIPLAIVALVFGRRFRLSGPDMNREAVTKTMDTVNNAVTDVRESVLAELQKDKQKSKAAAQSARSHVADAIKITVTEATDKARNTVTGATEKVSSSVADMRKDLLKEIELVFDEIETHIKD